MRIILLMLAGLLAGCFGGPQTFDLPCTVMSEPDGAVVEYRLVRKPHDELTPVEDPWVYLGRTPFRGKASIPRALIKEKGARLLLRVSKPGFNPVYREYAGEIVDIEHGLATDARLERFADTARQEKLK